MLGWFLVFISFWNQSGVYEAFRKRSCRVMLSHFFCWDLKRNRSPAKLIIRMEDSQWRLKACLFTAISKSNYSSSTITSLMAREYSS